jgi:hypothetical protein
LIPSASTGNTLYSSPSNAQDRDQGIAKFDHSFSAANQLSATFVIDDRWLGQDPFASGGSTIPGFGQTGTWKDKNLILRDTHTFSPALINEFRAAYHRLGTDTVRPANHTKLSDLGLGNIVVDDPTAEGPPSVNISGFSPWGNTIQGPQSRFENTFHYLDNVSWTRGRHYLKFGGDFRSFSQNQRFTFVNNGYMVIDGSGTLLGKVAPIAGLSSALNDFAGGFATLYAQSSKGRQGYRTRSANLFWQDDWKLKPNFSLNFGMRWEYNAPLTEVHDQVVAFRLGQKSTVFPSAPTDLVYPGDNGISRATYPGDWNNFAPRLGFAWDVFKNGKLSVRGGYGLFYDIPITTLTTQFLNVPPYGAEPYTYYTLYADPWATNHLAQPFPFQPAKPGQSFNFTPYAPLALPGVMDPHFATPYAQQFNLTVQYQVHKDWLVDAGYVGTSGTKLLNRRQINPAVPGPGATSGNTESRRILNLNHPDAAAFGGTPLGTITDQLTDASSIYNSLQASVTKRLSHGLLLTGAYTWSHAIDDASALNALDNGAPGRIDNARLDRGNSEQDVRHRFVMTYQYELPWWKQRRGALGHLLGGWELDGITTFQTGTPISVFENDDRALTGTYGQRPDYIGGDIQLYDPRAVSAVAGKPNSWFDGTGGGNATLAGSPFWRRVGSGPSWALGAGRYGNFGRNVLHGPGLNNFDVGVAKTFRITERQRLQLRSEAFNLVNHTQFKNPNGNDASVNFGRVTTTRDPRLIQLTLKYSF